MINRGASANCRPSRPLSATGNRAMYRATYLALPAALAASDLVATVPRRTTQQISAIAEIEIMPLAIDLSVPLSMAWHRRARSEPAQSWFRSLLIEAARD